MKFLTKLYRVFIPLLATLVVGIGIAPAASAAPATANSVAVNATSCNTTLAVGSQGVCVSNAQRALQAAGFNVGSSGADGRFGPATRSAVLAFQKANGIDQRGWIGPATRVALGKVSVQQTTTPASQPASSSGCGATLTLGSRGLCVTNAQRALVAAGFSVGNAGADGSFGTGTRSAVVKFQASRGLPQVGYIGPATHAALAKVPVKQVAAPAQPTTPTGFGHLVGRDYPGKVLIVDKSDRKVYAFERGKHLKTFPVRTGGVAYDSVRKVWVKKNTPTGVFWLQGKIKNGFSRIYNAEMPYFTVFNGNIGFHYSASFAKNGWTVPPEGRHLGTVAGSMDCVNLREMAHAKWIYEFTDNHTVIRVQE